MAGSPPAIKMKGTVSMSDTISDGDPSFAVGDCVRALPGSGLFPDTGTVRAIRGDELIVAWDSAEGNLGACDVSDVELVSQQAP